MSASDRTPSAADWTPEQDDRLAELYEANWSIGSIAGEMRRTVVAIKHRIKHLGCCRPVIKSHGQAPGGWRRALIDQTDDADEIMAARMAAAGANFGDHDLRLRSHGPRMSGGLAVHVGWQTVGGGE